MSISRRIIAYLLVMLTAGMPLATFAKALPWAGDSHDTMQHHSISVAQQDAATGKDGDTRCKDCAGDKCPHKHCIQSSCLDCGACVPAIIPPFSHKNPRFQAVWLALLTEGISSPPIFSLFRPPKA